jgi:hypothetical protein
MPECQNCETAEADQWYKHWSEGDAWFCAECEAAFAWSASMKIVGEDCSLEKEYKRHGLSIEEALSYAKAWAEEHPQANINIEVWRDEAEKVDG